MRATEFITESLDTNIEYKVVDSAPDLFTTTAEIDGSIIVFEAGAGGVSAGWSIGFYQYNQSTGRFTYKKTGTGSELAIFSFVMKSLTEFLSRYKPYVVDFTADKAESSRIKLYSRMIKKYADRLGYTMSDADRSPAVGRFRLTRKDGEGQYA